MVWRENRKKIVGRERGRGEGGKEKQTDRVKKKKKSPPEGQGSGATVAQRHSVDLCSLAKQRVGRSTPHR